MKKPGTGRWGRRPGTASGSLSRTDERAGSTSFCDGVQILERLGVPLQVLADRRAERLIASSNLWGRILHEPLRRLHPAGSDPIPIALARARPMRVVLPSDRIAGFPLQRLLDNQP